MKQFFNRLLSAELTDALETLRWNDAGLVAVVAQDRHTGDVRMLAHANREAVSATLATGEAWFFSRSRARLWKKGEESGNVLAVAEVWADCDGDALLYLVDPAGPSCHTGRMTCFYRRLAKDGGLVSESNAPESDAPESEVDGAAISDADPPAPDAPAFGRPTLSALGAILRARAASSSAPSYTRSLLDGGADRIGAKLREEAGELADAVRDESEARVVSEAADVMYHLMVGLLARGVELRDVEAELHRRFGQSGVAEKASRKTSSSSSS
jgi:phosphoribosyl-ATP pyrophosphohydrolase/phosphoribosyl-AMP cyclohydrolase